MQLISKAEGFVNSDISVSVVEPDWLLNFNQVPLLLDSSLYIYRRVWLISACAYHTRW